MPIYQRFQEPNEHTPRRVLYEDISLLFRPGDLVFVPLARPDENQASISTTDHNEYHSQMVFRMVDFRAIEVPSAYGTVKWDDQRTVLYVDSYDHDGKGSMACRTWVLFESFPGECEITSLACFPLKFHPNYNKVLSEDTARGRRFKNLIECPIKPHHYSGWTLAKGPSRHDKLDEKGAEYVDGEVIDPRKYLSLQGSRCESRDRQIPEA
ncbi:hypothetical protein AWENTII_007397 [Aspergillus wentii]|nr:ATPase, AAA [Aspergillus wentii]